MERTNVKRKVTIFYLAMIIVSLAFIALFAFMLFSVTTVKSLKDMDRAHLTLKKDIFEANEDEYYVYLYSAKSENNLEKKEEVETSVFSYATFYQKNKKSGVTKIYAYNVDDYQDLNKTVYEYLKSYDSEITQNNMPMLIKVSGDTIEKVYASTNTLQNELQSAISKVKK